MGWTEGSSAPATADERGRSTNPGGLVAQALQRAVDSGAIPGAVAVVTGPDQDLFEGAFGYADAKRTRPLEADGLFRIASMAKLFTSVLVMQLIESGQLDLDAPVGEYLPEFDQLPVIVGFDGDEPRFAEASRSPTIRELCAHMGGVSYELWNEFNLLYGEVTGHPRILSGFKHALTGFPRIAQPGSGIDYGMGLDWVGLVIEAITGERLEDRYQDRIFRQTGMDATSFKLHPSAIGRSMPVLRPDGTGGWEESGLGYPEVAEICPGGGCLFTTASDYAKLQRAIMHQGAAPGGRILESASVDQMFQPLMPEHRMPVLRTVVPEISADVTLGAGDRWGMGMYINDEDLPGMRRARSGGWAGVFNTYFWIDRTTGLAGALCMQYVPFYDAGAEEAFREFERAAYAEFGGA